MKTVIRRTPVLLLTAALGMAGSAAPALAQECFLGEVRYFAGNFAPRSWAFAHGQLLPISQNTALFSILGTQYGGDGRTTFALPDLRGRFPLGTGSGPGLTPRSEGQKGGAETTTLNVNQLPSHSHSAETEVQVDATARGYSAQGNTDSPAGGSWARLPREDIYSSSAPDVDMHPGAIVAEGEATTTVSNTGGGQPHDNMPPYTVINPIICLQGIFPSRS